ncbi:MAG: UvrD-helicase domain-containing protein [Bacillota bacterium]|nr:UvrD-helicase domain-containing protein [Bacillota bacterium]
MNYSPAQQQAIDIRNKNVIVSASAGSGKTSVLVQRLCDLVIKDKISIDHILSMTFTNDAAAEMKGRLMSSLQTMEQTSYIQEQLALLETASICTIDSFCLSIVQNYYYQIPISYTMSKQVASESQGKLALANAYQKACDALPVKELNELIRFYQCFGKTEENLQNDIQSAMNTAWAKPNPEEWLDQCKQPASLQWFYQYFIERIEALIEIYNEMIGIDDSFEQKIFSLQPCLDALHKQDYPAFLQAFRVYYVSTPAFKPKYNKEDYSSLQEDSKTLEKNIAKFLFDQSMFEADEKVTMPRLHTFIELTLLTKQYFDQEKRNMEIMDFNDIEHFAYHLLQQPMIQEEIRNKYEVILVDEFQDTNDLQESIIHCFERGNNVFRVGDVKQSIYGFRYAKPDIMKGHMKKNDALNQPLFLDENYRSNQSIVDFNNDFYEKIMNNPLTGKQFDDEDFAKVGSDRQRNGKQYPIRFIYTEYEPWAKDRKDDGMNVTKAKPLHNANKNDIIANDILKQHNKGKAFKEMCILTRSHAPQEALKKTLEAYGIPVLAEIDHGFYTNHAVQIVLSTLNAILNPYDDIALTACLLSPIFQIQTEQLAQACVNKNRYDSLYSHIKDVSFMSDFNEFRCCRFLSLPEIIRTLFAKNDFYYLCTTSQDKTNLDALLEMASMYEHPEDLRGFVQKIKEDADLDKVGEAYPFGKEADVVQIKTMHHSKGLQYPIVYIYSNHEKKDMDASSPVLIDGELGISFASLTMDKKIKRQSRSHIAFRTKKFHDDISEEMRVLYVATTRAEQELILVDTISKREDYSGSLNRNSLLKRRSYTSWFLHTYPTSTEWIHYEKIQDLYQTPKPILPATKACSLKMYTQEEKEILSQTASASKVHLAWRPLSLQKNMATKRGTLFHEMAAQLSFPYQKEECIRFASNRGYTMTTTDCEQFLSLNTSLEYQKWMSLEHQFELSYIVQEENALNHGFIDFICWDGDKIWIGDFKTDGLEKEQEYVDTYFSQLEMYKNSIQKMYPEASIQTAIYSFHLKKWIYL